MWCGGGRGARRSSAVRPRSRRAAGGRCPRCAPASGSRRRRAAAGAPPRRTPRSAGTRHAPAPPRSPPRTRGRSGSRWRSNRPCAAARRRRPRTAAGAPRASGGRRGARAAPRAFRASARAPASAADRRAAARSARRHTWSSYTSSKRRAQLLERLVHVGARRVLVAAERGGDLGVAEILELPQHERGPLPRRERLGRAPDGAELLAPLERRPGVGGERVGVHVGPTRRPVRAAASGVEPGVGRDAVQPGAGVGVRREPPEGAMGAHEGLLACVLGLLMVAEQAREVAHDLAPVALGQLGERDGARAHARVCNTPPGRSVKSRAARTAISRFTPLGCWYGGRRWTMDASIDPVAGIEWLAGLFPVRAARRRPLTGMFTDIAGFTAYAATRGDRAAARLVQRHDRAVLPAIRRPSGRILKRLGAGLMARFAS